MLREKTHFLNFAGICSAISVTRYNHILGYSLNLFFPVLVLLVNFAILYWELTWENVPILFTILGITWGNVSILFTILLITWVDVPIVVTILGITWEKCFPIIHNIGSNLGNVPIFTILGITWVNVPILITILGITWVKVSIAFTI